MKWLWEIIKIATGMLLILMGNASHAEEAAPVFMLNTSWKNIPLHTEYIEDEYWLFLPAFAQQDMLSVEDAKLEWWDTEFDEDGMWYVDILQQEEVFTVNVMRSENLRSLFLFSDDPANKGRSYVEDRSNRHENEAPAQISLFGSTGKLDYAGHIEKVRGRGNGTWNAKKVSYQLKLDFKADLLNTGDPANAAKKWLLLAEAVDDTFLRNQIVQDLGREIGVLAMESEYLDLYYDGTYCGTYRLSEKVEVGEGRINMMDYDQLIESWNKRIGQYNLDALTVGEAQNRFGNAYTYIEGVIDNQQPYSGGYLVEMESSINTLTDRCFFSLQNEPETLVYALKNPENASQQMVTYISERLQEAKNTLRAGGVNPETGETATEAFDLEAFARALLLQEWSGNLDGYVYSSSFFVLPEGETRFLPGPLWDFDLGYRYASYTEASGRGTHGFKDKNGWITDFYNVPEYLKIAHRIYTEEIYPLVKNVLLGQKEARWLKSVDAYADHIAASTRMNWMIWKPEREWRFTYQHTADEEVRYLKSFIRQRSEWLLNAFNDLVQAQEKSAVLWLDVCYGNPEGSVRILSAPWYGYETEILATEQISEATEQDYALWKVDAVLRTKDGHSLEGYSITVNGTGVTGQLQNDGSLLLSLTYEDRSYRPVDYYGDDVGLVYDHEAYVLRYPEIAQEYDGDKQAIMDYFFDEGIYYGQTGNGFFTPADVADWLPYVQEYLYDDWSMYYSEYIDWGYEADWLEQSVIRFSPFVTDYAE